VIVSRRPVCSSLYFPKRDGSTQALEGARRTWRIPVCHPGRGRELGSGHGRIWGTTRSSLHSRSAIRGLLLVDFWVVVFFGEVVSSFYHAVRHFGFLGILVSSFFPFLLSAIPLQSNLNKHHFLFMKLLLTCFSYYLLDHYFVTGSSSFHHHPQPE
jgi:hypothetical protein